MGIRRHDKKSGFTAETGKKANGDGPLRHRERRIMSIKPIETVYNGYRFRSRLEARWAVFFDALGIKYEYEPEGFQMSDGTMYLPDFYLPESKSFFEVKGIMSEEDDHKIRQFIKESEHCVTIGYDGFCFETCTAWWGDTDECQKFELDQGETQWLCKCRTCNKYWFMTSLGSYSCQCCGEYDGDHHFSVVMYSYTSNGKRYMSTNDKKAEMAIRLARQARFEHGETPKGEY